MLDLLAKDKKVISLLNDELISISYKLFQESKKINIESLNKLFKLHKIFEFSDKIKKRNYIKDNIN